MCNMCSIVGCDYVKDFGFCEYGIESVNKSQCFIERNKNTTNKKPAFGDVIEVVNYINGVKCKQIGIFVKIKRFGIVRPAIKFVEGNRIFIYGFINFNDKTVQSIRIIKGHEAEEIIKQIYEIENKSNILPEEQLSLF